jgi:hypothetical protein
LRTTQGPPRPSRRSWAEQVGEVVGVLLLVGEDVLEHPARGGVAVAEIACRV